MIEFGSYFHNCEINFHKDSNFFKKIGTLNYYESGRHALEAILKQEKWERIWIPAYFCYEVINHLSSLGIEIRFYDDNPLKIDDNDCIKKIPYQNNDVLLRTNYFGLRNKRSNEEINIPVIEDHTHAIDSEWALNSDADWCVASLRKSYPIAGGGILWSPQNKSMPKQLDATKDCEEMANIRYEAMKMKSLYLKNGGEKNVFREKFISSEDMIGNLSISGMDHKSFRLIQSMNIDEWTDIRRKNWNIAYDILADKFNILKPSATNDAFCPLSLIIFCDTCNDRDLLRQYLISNSIYPAILWDVPQDTNYPDALDFSKRMLSIHCDARYSTEDIKEMCKIINAFL